MNKKTQLRTTIIAISFLALAFSSCRKEKDCPLPDSPTSLENCKLISHTIRAEGFSSTVEFIYFLDGKLKQVTSEINPDNPIFMSFQYDEDRISSMTYLGMEGQVTYKNDSDKFPSEILFLSNGHDNMIFQFSENKNRIRSKTKFQIIDNTKELKGRTLIDYNTDGSLKSFSSAYKRFQSKEFSSTVSSIIVSDSKINPISNDYSLQLYASIDGLYEWLGSHNIQSIDYKNEAETKEYKYTYNEAGLPANYEIGEALGYPNQKNSFIYECD